MQDKNLSLLIWILLGIFFLVFLISIIAYFNTFNGALSTEHNIWALFGDYFGGFVGTILSFISILLILITIINQNETNKKLYNESTFFNMINIRERKINSFAINNKQGITVFNEELEIFRNNSTLSDNLLAYGNYLKELSDFVKKTGNEDYLRIFNSLLSEDEQNILLEL